MLICPQCQFENPDDNRFCQECGTSLTEKTCSDCGAKVAFDALQCPTCQAEVGTIWWVVITKPQSTAVAAPNSAGRKSVAPSDREPVTPDGNPIKVAAIDQSPASASQYLDQNQRYRIVEGLTPQPHPRLLEQQFRVLDCHPFQLSPLEVLLEHQSRLAAEKDEDGSSQSVLVEAEPDSSLSHLGIPAIVEPYILLQSQFHQALPMLHDAWTQADSEVLLLQDRTQLPLLEELWADDQVPPLQVLHWLHEMAELWFALEPWHCRQSLLELANLRVDEDHVVCLQRLYLESPATPLSVQTLGEFWQTLFGRTQRTQVGSIALLIHELQTGELHTFEAIQARIQQIAYEFQAQDVAHIDLNLTNAALDALPLEPSLRSEAKANRAATSAVAAAGMATREVEPSSSPLTLEDLDLETPGEDDATLLSDTVSDGEEMEAAEGDDTPTIVLPMQLYSLEDAGRTDVGRQRDHNEDYFGVQTELCKIDSPLGRTIRARGLYILCDGMGGHAGGEVASAMAVDTLKQYFQTHWFSTPIVEPGKSWSRSLSCLPSEDSIREAVYLANKAIYDVNQENARSGSGRMGTTLVLVLVQDTQVAVAHVGDSRLYMVSRRRGLEQVTTDHDVGQREIQRGVEPTIAYARPDAYQLTQALGPRDEHFVNPDVKFLDLNEDAVLLLCSDGLTDSDLLENHWRTHLQPLLSSQTNLDRGVSQLIDLANQYNGHDNITALAIRLKVRPNLEMMKMQ